MKKCNENKFYYLSVRELERFWWCLDFYWQFYRIIKKQSYAFKRLQIRIKSLKITYKNHNFINKFKELTAIAKELNIDTSKLKLINLNPLIFLHMLFAKNKNNINYFLLKDSILQIYKDFYELFFKLARRYLRFDDEICKITNINCKKNLF